MNPADVAQSALPVTADLFDLQPVPAGALGRETGDDRPARLLDLGLGDRHRQDDAVRPHQRAMDRFEQAFWSGQSLEELYRSLSARPTHSMAALFVAAMRGMEAQLREPVPRPLPACRCGSTR